jgi:hypothetical protein
VKTLHLTNSWHEKSGRRRHFLSCFDHGGQPEKTHYSSGGSGRREPRRGMWGYGRIYHLQAPRSLLNPGYRTIYPTQFLSSGSKLQEILSAEHPDLVEICDKYTLNYLGPLLRERLLPAVDFRPVVVGLSCERMDDNFGTYVGQAPLAKQFCSLYMKWLYFPFFDHHIGNSEYTVAELRPAAQELLVRRGT